MTKISQSEFEEWVDLYSTDLYLFALHHLSDPDTAKDALQDCFLNALQNFEHFKGNSSIKTWLKGILFHKCMDQLRRQYKTTQHHESYDTTIEEFCFDSAGAWCERAVPKQDWAYLAERDQTRLRGFLELCMQLLPRKWWLALQIQFSGEESKIERKEIGLSDANFWQVIRRAKLQLRSCIEDKGLSREDLA